MSYIVRSKEYLQKNLTSTLNLVQMSKGKQGPIWKENKAEYYNLVHDPDAKWIVIAEDNCSSSRSSLFEKNNCVLSKELSSLKDDLVRCRVKHLHFFWSVHKLNIVCQRLWKIFQSVGKTMVSVVEGHQGFARKSVPIVDKPCRSCHRIKTEVKKVKTSTCTTCGIVSVEKKIY